ncbi:GNAT family N-acetyltransferase [Arthrobacter sp. SX1312]|uniref:GNAT family N-acetyltransferase n=1 Tax=Arthrobacter sp. SX1312 TaxID=2058896 RepID=UPI0021577A4D|nr:GNAT family N-acetyltransferase [Arthrobacter sp. SX1312]
MSGPVGALLPDWPDVAPAVGDVVLRRVEDRDSGMVRDLATDPYVPLIGTLPPLAGEQEALAYIARQRQRHPEGTGFSFAIADARSDEALGVIGLWLRDYPLGRGQAGYAVAPAARGRGTATDALRALTSFAWTLPGLHRLELHIEPWNAASVGVARRAGFSYEGILRSYLEIGGERRDLAAYAVIRTAPPETVSPPATGMPTVIRDGRPTSEP